jgi:hypothetical protein
MKFRKNENPILLEWFDLQSVTGDSIRYLIEKEIATNGMRNLQHYIPAKRDLDSLKRETDKSLNATNLGPSLTFESQELNHRQSAQPQVQESASQNILVSQDHLIGGTIPGIQSTELEHGETPSDLPLNENRNQEKSPVKRKANKKYSQEVVDTYI